MGVAKLSFLILQNSTTCDSTDVNNNFYHVAQGSRLPMGGNSLESTDSVYDLGSSTATWNNLFCENIYINGSITTAGEKLWSVIAETTVTATASSVEFTGLNGDNDKEYKILFFGNSLLVGGWVYLHLNGDSTSNNYGQQRIAGADAAVSASRDTSITGWQIGYGHSFSEIVFNAKTSILKMSILNLIAQVQSTTVNFIRQISGVWNDTTNTITSLKIVPDVGSGVYLTPGTNIQLWKRN